MSLKTPLEALVDGGGRSSFSRFVPDPVQHVIKLFKHLGRILGYLLHAIEGVIGVDRVRRLQRDAGLFEG